HEEAHRHRGRGQHRARDARDARLPEDPGERVERRCDDDRERSEHRERVAARVNACEDYDADESEQDAAEPGAGDALVRQQAHAPRSSASVRRSPRVAARNPISSTAATSSRPAIAVAGVRSRTATLMKRYEAPQRAE